MKRADGRRGSELSVSVRYQQALVGKVKGLFLSKV